MFVEVGVFVLLKDDIIALKQTELETDCKIVWTKLEAAGYEAVFVASYYRPHENDKYSLAELQKSLAIICNTTVSHVWIGGDFNLPGYDWKTNDLKKGCHQPKPTRSFLDMISENGLVQIVEDPTFFENTLDLFLVNNPSGAEL